MRRTMLVALVVATGLSLTACSSSESSSTAESSAAVSTDAAGLCASFVAEGRSVEEATAAAEEAGYTTRLGTIDGEPQALTTDFLENRLTFDTQDGIVTGCVQG